MSDQIILEISHLQNVVIPDMEGKLTEALKHLREMTYMACSGEITQESSERIDQALAFLKEFEPMMSAQEPTREPLSDDWDGLPF